MLPQAILFDWDNTLVDSWRACKEAFNITLERFGHRALTEEEFRRRPQISLRDGFPPLFGEQWQAAEHDYYNILTKIHLDYIRPLTGAAELLESLRNWGVYVAVVSNKKGDVLRQEVQHLGWDRYFKKVVGARDAETDKPTLAPVKLALGLTNLELGNHIWFVGDSATDMECARNGGFTPIFLGTPETAELHKVDATTAWRLESCMQLREFISSRWTSFKSISSPT